MDLMATKTKSKIENKVKKTNNSNSIEPLSNSDAWLDYMADESFRLFPEKDNWRKRFCYTLLLWSLKPDSMEIIDFCDEIKISYDSFSKLTRRYDDIGQFFRDAKLRIAGRKRKGAAKNELNVSVFRDMHRYDPEWIPLMKELEDIKKDNSGSGDKIIIIEKFPESDSEDSK